MRSSNTQLLSDSSENRAMGVERRDKFKEYCKTNGERLGFLKTR
jgi:hypothetical protein